jgi:hypothetical protein
MLKLLFIFFFSIFLCFSANAMENLALHKTYSFSPKPNYPLCTDNSDTAQLTDGKSSGSRWTEKSTVGWRKPEPAVEVVIDLGQSCVIEQVNVHTIGGGFASVEFPQFIAVLLSDTRTQFKFAGLKSGRELKNIRSNGNRGVPHIMSIENINASGRFVKLVIRPKGLMFFMDEIEVVGEKVSDYPKNNLETFEDDEQLLNRIDNYLQLEDNISEFENSTKVHISSTNEILDINQLRAEQELLGKQKAEIYKDFYKNEFVCFPANPMKVVYEKEIPLQESSNEINVRMWQNEYESASFNIINCSDAPMNMSVSVSPLLGPEGQKIDSDKTFTIRRAQYVMAAKIGSIADALILQGENPFEIEPGQLIQIWLTTYNPELAAGDYEAKIAVSANYNRGEKLSIETIPINLKIHENKLPDRFALNTCVWDYYDVASEEEMTKDLNNHHINVCVIPVQNLPFPRFSSDLLGVTRKPDYSKLDKAIKLHQYAQTFLLGFSFSLAQKDFGRFGDAQWMTDEWKKVFVSWLINLVAHLKKLGIGYDNFALYPFDESIADEYYDLARLIKSTDPKIRLYANSFGNGPQEFMRFRDLIDIWCLQDSYIVRHPEWFETIKNFNTQMWTYECFEPMKAQKPYSYYRLLPWRAFQRSQSGAGFWIYYYGLGYEAGTVPWNDTLRPQGFSGVVYGAKSSPVAALTENIIPSRRWEAWREGAEDYQYLYEVQKTINKVKIKNEKAADDAQKTLDDQVTRVLSNPTDCNLVYEAREILTDTLQRLTNRKTVER